MSEYKWLNEAFEEHCLPEIYFLEQYFEDAKFREEYLTEDGNINRIKFVKDLETHYKHHYELFKAILKYGQNDNLDSHKKGACLFFAIMDIHPYEGKYEFQNEKLALAAACGYVHKHLYSLLKEQNISQYCLQHIKDPLIFKPAHPVCACLFEKDDYLDCFCRILHIECRNDNGQLKKEQHYNYAWLSLILFHYDRATLLWVQSYTGFYVDVSLKSYRPK